MPAKELLGQKAFDFNRAAQLAILERAVITTRGPGKAVLKALDSYQRENPSSFPSAKTLAHSIGCSVRTVKRATHELQALGLITIESRSRPDGSQTSNHYSIVWSRILDAASPLPVSRGGATVSRGGATVSRGGATVSRGGATVSPPSISVHVNDQLKNGTMEADGNLNSLHSEGRRAWWGRSKPLAKADLLDADSAVQLWQYARRREWIGPTELERFQFFALCHYVATSRHVKSAALLTTRMSLRLPPDRAAERFRGICLADEEFASRLQRDLRRRQPVAPDTRAPVVAVAAAIGVPSESRPSRDEQIKRFNQARKERGLL